MDSAVQVLPYTFPVDRRIRTDFGLKFSKFYSWYKICYIFLELLETDKQLSLENKLCNATVKTQPIEFSGTAVKFDHELFV